MRNGAASRGRRLCPDVECLEGRVEPSTISVLNTRNSSPDSLRATIEQANLDPVQDLARAAYCKPSSERSSPTRRRFQNNSVEESTGIVRRSTPGPIPRVPTPTEEHAAHAAFKWPRPTPCRAFAGVASSPDPAGRPSRP